VPQQARTPRHLGGGQRLPRRLEGAQVGRFLIRALPGLDRRERLPSVVDLDDDTVPGKDSSAQRGMAVTQRLQRPAELFGDHRALDPLGIGHRVQRPVGVQLPREKELGLHGRRRC
jgi:hypothetical protein